jgi:hypothetical protein
MAVKSLLARKDDLAITANQLKKLNSEPFSNGELESFRKKLEKQGLFPLKPIGLDVFQVNVGYMCNQVCSHCHVAAWSE